MVIGTREHHFPGACLPCVHPYVCLTFLCCFRSHTFHTVCSLAAANLGRRSDSNISLRFLSASVWKLTLLLLTHLPLTLNIYGGNLFVFLFVVQTQHTGCEIIPDSGWWAKFTYRVMETAETGNNLSPLFIFFLCHQWCNYFSSRERGEYEWRSPHPHAAVIDRPLTAVLPELRPSARGKLQHHACHQIESHWVFSFVASFVIERQCFVFRNSVLFQLGKYLQLFVTPVISLFFLSSL